METWLINLITQFGGLGAVVGFAYILLKAHLKQVDSVSRILDNHFKHDEQALDNIRKSLAEIAIRLGK